MLLMISIAQAAPPGLQENPVYTTGLEIIYPQNPAFKQGENFALHFHIANITNGMPIDPSSVSCYIHVYNGSDSHVLQKNLTIDSNGLELTTGTLNSTYSKTIGVFPYLVNCNNSASSLGGFVSTTYEITADGRYYTENSSALPFIVYLLGVVGIFFWFGSMIKEDELGQALKLLMNLAGLAMLIIGAGYLMVTMQTLGVSQESYNLAFTIYNIILWILVFIIAIFLWIFIVKLIEYIRNLRRPSF